VSWTVPGCTSDQTGLYLRLNEVSVVKPRKGTLQKCMMDLLMTARSCEFHTTWNFHLGDSIIPSNMM
jgi:hypothetical protein